MSLLRRLAPALAVGLGLLLVPACKTSGFHKSFSVRWEEQVVNEDPLTSQLAGHLEDLKEVELDEEVPLGYRNYLPPTGGNASQLIRVLREPGRDVFGVDHALNMVAEFRMKLGSHAPEELKDPRVWADYLLAAQNAGRNAKTPVEATALRLTGPSKMLDELSRQLSADLARPANPKPADVVAFSHQLRTVSDEAAGFLQAWNSLVVLPVQDTVRMLEAMEPSTEFMTIGSITAAQQKLDVVLTSLEEIHGKRIVFDSKLKIRRTGS